MNFHFRGSDQPTIGVELELQIINPNTLDLTPHAELLLTKCENEGLDRVKSEIHQSMIEIDSEISMNVKQCRAYLEKRIEGLVRIADDVDLALGLAGTHPFQRWPERRISSSERYQFLHQKFQWLTRRMNVYGMHVHVGVPSGEKALAISQAVIRYLPHLLALSANSPYWHGVDTGMNSSRISIMESFPFSGLPPLFPSWSSFEHYIKTLHQAGAISSLKDLYWYVRPNLEFGTLEFRICDVMSSLDTTIALTALIQCLVVWISERLDARDPRMNWSQEEHWIALENHWTAARDGLDGAIITNLQGSRQKISDSLIQLIEELTPVSKQLNCEEELYSLLQVIEQGNGAKKQRDVFNETGSLQDVVSSYILSLRPATA